MKKIQYITLTALLLFTAIPVKAEISPGEVWGVAWTIGNAIVGTTTLTPATMVDTYHRVYQVKNISNGRTTMTKNKLKLDFVTKAYFYNSESIAIDGTRTTSTAPFMLTGIHQMNYDVDVHGISTNILIRTETNVQKVTMRVWLAKVEKTGLWPDDGPWTVYVKTTGHKGLFPIKRYFPQEGPEINFWAPASLRQAGSQVVTLGTPTCFLAYPPYCGEQFYN